MKKIILSLFSILLGIISLQAQTVSKQVSSRLLQGVEINAYQAKLQARGSSITLQGSGDMITIKGTEKEVAAFIDGINPAAAVPQAEQPIDYTRYVISKTFDPAVYGQANINATAQKHKLTTQTIEGGIMLTGDITKVQAATGDLVATLNNK